MAILIIGFTVLIIISVIIFNPWAAAMVFYIIINMTFNFTFFNFDSYKKFANLLIDKIVIIKLKFL